MYIYTRVRAYIILKKNNEQVHYWVHFKLPSSKLNWCKCIIKAFPDYVAPEKVKGLRAKYIQKRSEGSYDVAVNWNKPILQPDNYTLQFDSFQFKPRLLVVSGVSIIAKYNLFILITKDQKFLLLFYRMQSQLSSWTSI